MKNIDFKSLAIGALLTSTIFLGVAATSPTDKWDNEQLWEYGSVLASDFGKASFALEYYSSDDPSDTKVKLFEEFPKGWEIIGGLAKNKVEVRRRVK